MNLTPKTEEEIKAFVKEKTGCGSFFLFCGEEKCPCPDELAGETCKGHESGILYDSISDTRYLLGILADVYSFLSGGDEIEDSLGEED